jgi:hypothetical protein
MPLAMLTKQLGEKHGQVHRPHSGRSLRWPQRELPADRMQRPVLGINPDRTLVLGRPGSTAIQPAHQHPLQGRAQHSPAQTHQKIPSRSPLSEQSIHDFSELRKNRPQGTPTTQERQK